MAASSGETAAITPLASSDKARAPIFTIVVVFILQYLHLSCLRGFHAERRSRSASVLRSRAKGVASIRWYDPPPQATGGESMLGSG
ncbi:hypothetical protein D3C80_1777630 [compost metagenome]